MKNFDLSQVSGGNPALLLHPAILYPTTGCVGFMGAQYIKDPNSTREDYARSCTYGAMHGLNPGLGITARFVANPYARYGAGIAYGAGAAKVSQYIFRMRDSDMNSCPFDPVNASFDGDQ